MKKHISDYFTDLSKSRYRIFDIFFNAAAPGAATGLITLSGDVALGVTGLLVIHGVMRDVVSLDDKKPQNPHP